jgi:hypothetical protein
MQAGGLADPLTREASERATPPARSDIVAPRVSQLDDRLAEQRLAERDADARRYAESSPRSAPCFGPDASEHPRGPVHSARRRRLTPAPAPH